MIPDHGRYVAPRKITDDQAREALRRYQAGERPPDLAREYGISESGLRARWLRMDLIDPPPAPRPLTVRELAEAERELQGGRTSIKAIAARLGRDPSNLRERLRERGVRRPPALPSPNLDRDRRIVALLLDGKSWLDILAAVHAPGHRRTARNRLIQAVERYCAREGLPLPAGTYAPLRPGNWSRRGWPASDRDAKRAREEAGAA